MSLLDELRPTKKRLVIDLVREAGVDVSDWANFKGGKTKAASNPRYCYDWAFVEPGKVAVLNLWFDQMEQRDGTLSQSPSYRDRASPNESRWKAGIWRKRALLMERAVRTAFEDGLPVRVIVCDGSRRDPNNLAASASLVTKRLLDPVPWAVTEYDDRSGFCLIARGASPVRFVDQFDLAEDDDQPPERRSVIAYVFPRDPKVRRRALLRSKGRCEWCGELGFVMDGGRVFLETHHVVPLSEGGADVTRNVAALCANHHREAHHGAQRSAIRERLRERIGGGDGA